jgi:hypothetical protein
MNVGMPRPDPAALEAAGSEHLAARRFEAAAEAFEAAAELAERPSPELMLKLARAHLEAGRPGAAAGRLFGVVDAGAGFRTWAAAAALLARCPDDSWPGVRHRLRAGLVGTWTTNTFAPLLRLAAARHGIALKIEQPDFGQYFNATLDPGSALLTAAPEVLVLAPDHRALGLRAFSDSPAEDVAAELAGGPADPRPARLRRAGGRPPRPPRRRGPRGPAQHDARPRRRPRRPGGGGGRRLRRREPARRPRRRGGLV